MDKSSKLIVLMLWAFIVASQMVHICRANHELDCMKTPFARDCRGFGAKRANQMLNPYRELLVAELGLNNLEFGRANAVPVRRQQPTLIDLLMSRRLANIEPTSIQFEQLMGETSPSSGINGRQVGANGRDE